VVVVAWFLRGLLVALGAALSWCILSLALQQWGQDSESAVASKRPCGYFAWHNHPPHLAPDAQKRTCTLPARCTISYFPLIWLWLPMHAPSTRWPLARNQQLATGDWAPCAPLCKLARRPSRRRRGTARKSRAKSTHSFDACVSVRRVRVGQEGESHDEEEDWAAAHRGIGRGGHRRVFS
jgi:4-amino-4-deoxy-L-arabinose transferase-like glycosyltransferase